MEGRATRAQIIAGAALAAIAAGFGFLACRQPPRPRFPAASAEPRASAAPSAAPAASVVPASSVVAPAPTAAPEEAAIQKLMACTEPAARIVDPPAGAVFNNAMTSADAGFIDRTQGVLDALAARSQAFRCCFAPWLAESPSEPGKALLRVTIDPAGAPTAAEVDAARSTIHTATTVACLAAVARSIDYPPSPTHNETIVEYPFRVAAQPQEGLSK